MSNGTYKNTPYVGLDGPHRGNKGPNVREKPLSHWPCISTTPCLLTHVADYDLNNGIFLGYSLCDKVREISVGMCECEEGQYDRQWGAEEGRSTLGLEMKAVEFPLGGLYKVHGVYHTQVVTQFYSRCGHKKKVVGGTIKKVGVRTS